MPNREATLRIAPSKGDAPVKPEPPDDLWERIAEVDASVRNKRPPNTFTRAEFAERFHLARATAFDRIKKMMNAGLLEQGGSGGYIWYRLK